jgi:hypothetical protein
MATDPTSYSVPWFHGLSTEVQPTNQIVVRSAACQNQAGMRKYVLLDQLFPALDLDDPAEEII